MNKARLATVGAVLVLGVLAAAGIAKALGVIGTPGDVASRRDPASRTGAEADNTVTGLSASQDGYTLALASPTHPLGLRSAFDFTITGPDGEPVTGYTPTHDKELHLIVVRRDTTGFQHVHPERDDAGRWSVPLTLPAAGVYKIFADFAPAGQDEALTLTADVSVPGQYQPRSLPAVSRTATVDGYTVQLAGDLVAAEESHLTFTVTNNGRPVRDLEPYLAAYGHLVALRAGDLAYLHVHPDGEPGDGRTPPGPDIIFYAQAPSSGEYRLYLDFQHDGAVRTVEFTATATAARPSAPSATTGTTPPSEPPEVDDQPHGH